MAADPVLIFPVGTMGGNQERVDGAAWFQIRVRGSHGRGAPRQRVLPVVLLAPPTVAHPDPVHPLPAHPLPVFEVLPRRVARPSARPT